MIDLHQVLQDEINVYFVTEYMPGGELYHILNSKGILPEDDARAIFGQIASALSWCHDRNICHRDLKPENILLDKDRKKIKIADFGMATMQSMDVLLKTSCGSPHYASPEIIMGIPYFGPAADVWSAGIILYTLLTGNLPFDDHHVGRLLKKIKTGRFKKIPSWVSPSAKDLIYKILVRDPNRRINFNDILSHPWMAPYVSSHTSNHLSMRSLMPLQCNPWHDDQLKKPLILNSGGLNGPIRETLKVLWRNLTQDQIVAALMDAKPNLPKLTYYLLLQRQKRQSDYYVERSTDSMEKNSNNCNTTKSSFYNTTIAEPCDGNCDLMPGTTTNTTTTTIQIDHNVLLTPSLDMESDITFDGIKNRLNNVYPSLVSPQLQPNRTQKASSKTSSLTLLSIPQDPALYPNSIHSSITRFSQNNIPIHLKIKSTPTLHETLDPVISTLPAVPLSHSKLKSHLLLLLLSNQNNHTMAFAKPLLKVLEASCRLTDIISSTYIKLISRAATKNQSHQSNCRTVIEQELPDNSVAKV